MKLRVIFKLKSPFFGDPEVILLGPFNWWGVDEFPCCRQFYHSRLTSPSVLGYSWLSSHGVGFFFGKTGDC